MGRTVSDVIDRVFREWLYPVDDQPPRIVLDGAITDSATSLTYLDSYLLIEEEYLISPGQLIEIDSELIMVGSVDPSTNTISGLRRGMMGTTAAAHADGAVGIMAPLYSRKAAFDAIRSTVSRLFPRLYKRTSYAVTATGSPEIPNEARIIEGFVYVDNSEICTISVQAVDSPSATTGRVLVFAVENNKAGHLIYRAPFTLPTAETDDIEVDLGLLPEYEDLLVYATVSSMVAGRDFDAISVENLHRQVNNELFPIGSAVRLRRELKLMYDELIEELKDNLLAQNGVPISFSGWST